MKAGFRLFCLLAVALIALDQVVKVWARTAAGGVEGHTFLSLWPNVFELKLVYNEGVAFGMMQGAGVYLTPVAVAIAGLAGWYSWNHAKNQIGLHVTCALLAAGSIGNLVDRIARGKVTDMFWFRPINFPVFNVADVCITVAGTLFILGALRDTTKGPKSMPPDATAADKAA